MERASRTSSRRSGRTEVASRARRHRRWYDVRVETDGGTLVGRLPLARGSGSLAHVVRDGRAYLSLWEARCEDLGLQNDFVAIYKATIRSVTLLGEASTRVSVPQGGRR